MTAYHPLVWIVEIFKVIMLTGLGALLLFRWRRAERHFYTDMPFLFSWGFFFVAAGEAVDVVFHMGILPVYDLMFFKIRALLPGVSLLFFLFAVTLIWLADNRRLGNAISLIYIILYVAVVVLAPASLPPEPPENLLRLLIMPFLLAVYVVFAVSFLLAWAWKRLPDVHGLLISLGGAVTMIGQFLKNYLEGMGLLWVSELIDLLGLMILWAGLFIKPGYAK